MIFKVFSVCQYIVILVNSIVGRPCRYCNATIQYHKIYHHMYANRKFLSLHSRNFNFVVYAYV